MQAYKWYSQLKKPSWAPPSWLFGPAWTFLYLLIIISFSQVFLMAWNKAIPAIVTIPFVLNIIFNIIFTPIQFGLRNNLLAALDILLLLASLIWAALAIFPYAPLLTYIQIPYLLWVCFATVLQLTITFLNRHESIQKN